jgi:hypothetical protein
VFSLIGQSFAGLGAGAAAVVAAAGTAAVVALYLLREHERRVAVPFVPLWDPHGGPRRIERMGRRLRRWLSLLLALTILWLLVVALVDPRPAATGPAARSWLVLLDRSASMSARVEAPGTDRMAEARRQAHRTIAALGSDDRAMVASFARAVTAESGFEADHRRLDAAVDSVAPAEVQDEAQDEAMEGADGARALAFAAAVLRGRPRPTVVIIGDGRYQVPAPAGLDVRFVPVGAPPGTAPADNLAILGLSARRRPLDPSAVDVTVVVGSFARREAQVTVELFTGAGAARPARMVERVPLTVGAGQQISRTVGPLVIREAEIEARLAWPAGSGVEDRLALDDRAAAVVPERIRRQVLVVRGRGGDLYLDGALLSFGDALAVRHADASQGEALRAEWSRFDLVVFDEVAPAPPPAAGHYLYLDPSGPGSPWPERGVALDPVPTDADRRHPLLAQISLADLNIRQARRLVPAPGDQVVVASLGVPLVLARSRAGLRMVGVSFSVRRSDLPLRPSFPLLLANTFEWLDSRSAGRATRRGGADTAQAAGAGGGGEPFDATESDLRQPPALLLDGRPVAPWQPPRPARPPFSATVALILALALSLVEWASHHGRWTV